MALKWRFSGRFAASLQQKLSRFIAVQRKASMSATFHLLRWLTMGGNRKAKSAFKRS